MRQDLLLRELSNDVPKERIKGLLTMNGNVLISAYRKAGKTTLILSLLNALTSEAGFLGRACKPVEGSVVYVNLELHQNMLREYALKVGMELDNESAIFQDYRGYGAELMIRDYDWRSEYAEHLLKRKAKALIIDPVSLLFVHSMADSNNNDEAREVMEMLAHISVMAELDHLFIVDHTGHADKHRARGASGKEDWADIIWNVTGEKEQPRLLTAVGRGVQGGLKYIREDGRLVEADEEGHAMNARNRILNVLRDSARSMTVIEICLATNCSQSTASMELKTMKSMGQVELIGKTGHSELWGACGY